MAANNKVSLSSRKNAAKTIFISHDRKNIKERLDFLEIEYMGYFAIKANGPGD